MSWHVKSRTGAVDAAYAETDALGRDCPNCGAAVDNFCTFPDGAQRHMPCRKRITDRKAQP